MSYVTAMGPCYSCRRIFSFNPELVPSIRINTQGAPDPNGSREPVCRSCIERANQRRLENGLEPIAILPGAYEAQECA